MFKSHDYSNSKWKGVFSDDVDLFGNQSQGSGWDCSKETVIDVELLDQVDLELSSF